MSQNILKRKKLINFHQIINQIKLLHTQHQKRKNIKIKMIIMIKMKKVWNHILFHQRKKRI